MVPHLYLQQHGPLLYQSACVYIFFFPFILQGSEAKSPTSEEDINADLAYNSLKVRVSPAQCNGHATLPPVKCLS